MRRTRQGTARTRAPLSSLLLAVVSVSALAGCGVPIPGDLTAPSAPVTPAANAPVDVLVPVDVGSAVLAAELRTIAAAITAARTPLDTVAALLDGPAGPLDAVRAEGAATVDVLLGDGAGGAPGLLPARQSERGGPGADDLLTGLVTLAGDVGGDRARLVLELVRDPMVGDLGAWQRDPVGVILLVRSTVADATDPAQLDAGLLAIPGELTRALGYATAVATAEDPVLAAHAARQGATRLGVVLIAIELALEELERGAR